MRKAALARAMSKFRVQQVTKVWHRHRHRRVLCSKHFPGAERMCRLMRTYLLFGSLLWAAGGSVDRRISMLVTRLLRQMVQLRTLPRDSWVACDGSRLSQSLSPPADLVVAAPCRASIVGFGVRGPHGGESFPFSADVSVGRLAAICLRNRYHDRHELDTY